MAAWSDQPPSLESALATHNRCKHFLLFYVCHCSKFQQNTFIQQVLGSLDKNVGWRNHYSYRHYHVIIKVY